MKKNIPDYLYALTEKDINTPLDKRLTPEQVAQFESLKGHSCYHSDDQNNRWKSLRGNKNAHVSQEDRTPKQQDTYERNLRYRTKYKEKRARLKLAQLKEHLKRTNPNTDPRLYVKLLRNIKRNEERIQELLDIKEIYGL